MTVTITLTPQEAADLKAYAARCNWPSAEQALIDRARSIVSDAQRDAAEHRDRAYREMPPELRSKVDAALAEHDAAVEAKRKTEGGGK